MAQEERGDLEVRVGDAVEVEMGGLRFSVARREVGADGGTSIEVYGDVDGAATQVLRFDCFRREPHYHMPPGAPGQLALDPAEVGDGLAWALACTRERLPEMIRAAGFAELAGRVDRDALARGWERVREAAARAPEPTRSFRVDAARLRA
jgi:hypothetical protein